MYFTNPLRSAFKQFTLYIVLKFNDDRLFMGFDIRVNFQLSMSCYFDSLIFRTYKTLYMYNIVCNYVCYGAFL